MRAGCVRRQAKVVAHQLSHTPQVDSIFNVPAGKVNLPLLSEHGSAAANWKWIMCSHKPQCPSAGDTARAAAHVVAGHPEQGWSLLCNGIVLFDDGGLLLPDGAPTSR